jgi:cephalosporin hydroxylase
VKTREDLLKLIPKNGVCAEIGVFEGEFSKAIICEVAPLKMYMVDIFCGKMCSADKNGNNMKWIEMDDSYSKLKKEYENDPNVVIYKGSSESFFKDLSDGYLDFVYIDADHSYNGVKSDLENSYSKVKVGGFIAGHDYCQNFQGVIKAVNEFCDKYKLAVEITTDDGCNSYLIQR